MYTKLQQFTKNEKNRKLWQTKDVLKVLLTMRVQTTPL